MYWLLSAAGTGTKRVSVRKIKILLQSDKNENVVGWVGGYLWNSHLYYSYNIFTIKV